MARSKLFIAVIIIIIMIILLCYNRSIYFVLSLHRIIARSPAAWPLVFILNERLGYIQYYQPVGVVLKRLASRPHPL